MKTITCIIIIGIVCILAMVDMAEAHPPGWSPLVAVGYPVIMGPSAGDDWPYGIPQLSYYTPPSYTWDPVFSGVDLFWWLRH